MYTIGCEIMFWDVASHWKIKQIVCWYEGKNKFRSEQNVWQFYIAPPPPPHQKYQLIVTLEDQKPHHLWMSGSLTKQVAASWDRYASILVCVVYWGFMRLNIWDRLYCDNCQTVIVNLKNTCWKLFYEMLHTRVS